MATLFSLGYQERDLAAFIDELLSAEVDIVVDVRENPWSRKRGFSRVSLSEALDAVGIHYLHARFAGNPKELRHSASTYDECLAMYEDHLDAHPEILWQFGEMVDGIVASGLRACLVCYERHPHDCHRSLLVEAWQRQEGGGVEVVHLAPSGSARLSSRTDPAASLLA